MLFCFEGIFSPQKIVLISSSLNPFCLFIIKCFSKIPDFLGFKSLTGIRVVRAYNAEDYQDKKFEAANDEVTRLNPQ